MKKNLKIATFIISSIVLVIISWNYIYSHNSQKKINKKKEARLLEWKKELEKFPIPDGAIPLKKIHCIPTETQEDQDIYFHRASSFCIDANQNIYVSDTRESKILKFDTQGNFLRQIGRKGQGPSELQGPSDIAFDLSNRIWVRDGGNRRIQIYDTDGNIFSSFKYFISIQLMELNKKGLLYVSTVERGPQKPLFYVFNEKGSIIKSFGQRRKFRNETPFHNEILASTIPTPEGGLVVLWQFFDFVRIYSDRDEMLADIKINYRTINEIAKLNTEAQGKYDMIQFHSAINGLSTGRKSFYVLSCFPRIEIIELNYKGHITDIYWYEPSSRYSADDFYVLEKDNGEKLFFILQSLPDNKLDIFAINASN